MRGYFSKLLPLALLLFTSSVINAQSDTESSGEEFGLAAYYHDDFEGRKTNSGETYNPNQMTAAHMRHPFNTMLRVTRLDNNKSVIVRVNDRGPYITGRVVDLSRAAAEKLGMLKEGVAEVKVEVVKRGKATTEQTVAKEDKPKAENTSSNTPSSYDDASAKRIETTKTESQTAAKQEAKTSTASKGTNAKPQLVGKEYQKYGLYKIAIEKPGEKGFAVQVASLENYENVFQQVADLQAKWFDNILISIEKGKTNPIYKILLGPFESESAANNYLKNLQKKHKIKGFVVDLSTVTY
ncbi:MAG: septal ring lytic transglycosylase RlpA family protein [Phaeodactylibacter sp.]|nr:septal ring lytic transglycosylase RlpA family protein [Phaeodactylibacter sp.]MCB9275299.1 septal ring lytic transglycosylase RlpA family protein [Lewinellaceae bacterium]